MLQPFFVPFVFSAYQIFCSLYFLTVLFIICLCKPIALYLVMFNEE